MPLADVFARTRHISGTSSLGFDYARIFNKWIIANGLLHLGIMAGVTVFAWTDRGRFHRALKTLVAFGWINWLLFLLQARNPTMRLVWPSDVSFAIVLGHFLVGLWDLAETKGLPVLRQTAVAVTLGMVVFGGVNAVRAGVMGEANLLAWEYSRQTVLTPYFRLFQHKVDQLRMAEYLRDQIPAGESIGVVGRNLELELLSGVKVVPLAFYATEAGAGLTKPSRLLITPSVGRGKVYLSSRYLDWMHNHLTKEAQFGRYALYRVSGAYPADIRELEIYAIPHPQHPLTSDEFAERPALTNILAEILRAQFATPSESR